MSTKQIRTAIVDDHTLFRTGMKNLLQTVSDIEVVGEAENGEEFLDLIKEESIDVVLMDISMPIMNGIEATRLAIQQQHSLRILGLSMFGEQLYYSKMLEHGAKGFLLKDSSFEELTEAIHTVYEGNNYLSKQFEISIKKQTVTAGNNILSQLDISNREHEILVEICRGQSNQEIADSLFISKRTVEKHRSNILLKAECNNTASLVVFAIKNHLVEI